MQFEDNKLEAKKKKKEQKKGRWLIKDEKKIIKKEEEEEEEIGRESIPGGVGGGEGEREWAWWRENRHPWSGTWT